MSEKSENWQLTKTTNVENDFVVDYAYLNSCDEPWWAVPDDSGRLENKNVWKLFFNWCLIENIRQYLIGQNIARNKWPGKNTSPKKICLS